MVSITIVNGVYKPTNITGGHHLVVPNQTKKDHGTFWRQGGEAPAALAAGVGPRNSTWEDVDLDGSLIGFLSGRSWKLMGINGS